MSDVETAVSPRDRARRDASFGAIYLMRLLMVIGLVESVAILLALSVDPLPDLIPYLGNGTRAVLAGVTFWVGKKLQGWANLLGFGLWLGLGRGFAMMSFVVAVIRAIGLTAPAGIPDDVWPGLIATLAHVGTVGALALIVFVVSRFAAEADLIGAGRHLAWAALPLFTALVAGLGFLEKTLLPVWWLGAALVIATPWALCIAKVLDWARALLPTLLVGTTLVMLTLFETDPRIVMGLAAIAGIVIAAAFPRAPLAALNMLLAQVAAPAPTRTFIRRLLDGPIDPEASRLGSQMDASNAEESLALAYRELGIEPREKVTSPAPQSMEPLGPIAKLEPISRRVPLVVVPDVPLIDVAERPAWQSVARALDRVFLGFVLRTAVFVAAILLTKSPFLRHPAGPSIAVALLAGAGAISVAGFVEMRAMPRRAYARRGVTFALVAGGVMLALDVAVAIAFGVAPESLGTLMIFATLAWLTFTLATIATLAMSFADLRATTRRSRALVPTLVLGAYTLFAATDKEILSTLVAVPAGVAAAVLGTVFFISMLWLVNDARGAVRDWETRASRMGVTDEPDAEG